MSNRNGWVWNENHQAYLYGEPNNGCGVFFIETVGNLEGYWVYNVICNNNLESDYGPFKTKEEAMKEAENCLHMNKISE